MNKIFATLLLALIFNFTNQAQITISSSALNYDTIFGGTDVYYQYAWDEPLIEDYPETFKLSKPLKAFENIWDSARVSDGSLMLVSSDNPDVLLLINGTGWDLIDKGYENDSIGLTNISPVKISDSMDRVEWRSFGFANEYDSTLQLPSSGSVQIKVNAGNTLDIIFGDFAIVDPFRCFEGFGSLRPSVTYFYGLDSNSFNTWFIYGDPTAPTIGTLSDTAFANLPALGQTITLDFNKTNKITKTAKLQLRITPNPVTNRINLEGLKSFEESPYQIIAMDGKVVSKGKLRSNEVDVELLIKGNYILKISNNNQLYIARFTKD